jgi:hypothetical protein
MELSKVDKNIGLHFETGRYVHYLDMRISVESLKFRTKLFRKLVAQTYIFYSLTRRIRCML